MNKTTKYLVRSLLLLDTEENIRVLLSPNVTVGAMHEHREGLFLCYNFRQLDNSELILKHARSRSYFVSDYLVGHPLYGDCHMVQLRPDMRVYRKFIQSKFSSMYTPEQLEIVASNKKQHAWYVLRRDPSLLKELEAKIEKLGSKPEYITELDDLIDPKEEFFDYPIIDPLEFKQRQYESK